ncbi:hypothetical protein D3C72_1232860 [compost metagenome]
MPAMLVMGAVRGARTVPATEKMPGAGASEAASPSGAAGAVGATAAWPQPASSHRGAEIAMPAFSQWRGVERVMSYSSDVGSARRLSWRIRYDFGTRRSLQNGRYGYFVMMNHPSAAACGQRGLLLIWFNAPSLPRM